MARVNVRETLGALWVSDPPEDESSARCTVESSLLLILYKLIERDYLIKEKKQMQSCPKKTA